MDGILRLKAAVMHAVDAAGENETNGAANGEEGQSMEDDNDKEVSEFLVEVEFV